MLYIMLRKYKSWYLLCYTLHYIQIDLSAAPCNGNKVAFISFMRCCHIFHQSTAIEKISELIILLVEANWCSTAVQCTVDFYKILFTEQIAQKNGSYRTKMKKVLQKPFFRVKSSCALRRTRNIRTCRSASQTINKWRRFGPLLVDNTLYLYRGGACTTPRVGEIYLIRKHWHN